MNLLWRTLFHFLFSRSTPALGPLDVSVSSYRVLPTDLDLYGHMNNGRYFSIADLARFDLIRRRGVWKQMQARGWYPVAAASTISYRKSLEPWQKFQIETRLLGADALNVFIEQRFVVDGEIHARLFLRTRFLKRTGGHAPMDELLELWGVDSDTLVVPEWLLRWAKDAALPPSKQPAPSEWD